MITISHNVANQVAVNVIAAAQAAGFDTETLAVETKTEVKTRTAKPSDKICQDMKNLAVAMTKAKSKHPISGEEAQDVHAALVAIRELFDFIEGSGAKAHVVRAVNLVLNGKVSRTEYNELVKHFAEVVIPAAVETEQLKEVDALEAAAK